MHRILRAPDGEPIFTFGKRPLSHPDHSSKIVILNGFPLHIKTYVKSVFIQSYCGQLWRIAVAFSSWKSEHLYDATGPAFVVVLSLSRGVIVTSLRSAHADRDPILADYAYLRAQGRNGMRNLNMFDRYAFKNRSSGYISYDKSGCA